MSKILIHAEDFLYVARFSSVDQTRYYLAGVRVEPHDGYCLLVATDGHRCGILRVMPDDATGEYTKTDPSEFVTVPNDKDFLTSCRGKNRMIRIDTEAETITLFTAGDIGARVGAIFPMRDMGTYPDWRKIMPSGAPSGEFADRAYNAKYIKDFANGGGVNAVCVAPNGGNPAIVTTSDDRFVGVLMPIRHNSTAPESQLYSVIGDV